MADFCTVDDLEELLQIPIEGVEQIASAGRAIKEATAAIRNYCHQYLELVEDEEITLDNCLYGTKLFLPELPVVSVSSVEEDGETLAVTTDYKLGQYGILHRVNRRWARGIQIITVTYTHGHETLPDDVVQVAVRAAARSFQAGLKSAEMDGISGVSSRALGDFSEAFSSEAGGGISEGIMGVSGARILLLSEKDILDEYRYKSL
jgi:hypothetical protein